MGSLSHTFDVVPKFTFQFLHAVVLPQQRFQV